VAAIVLSLTLHAQELIPFSTGTTYHYLWAPAFARLWRVNCYPCLRHPLLLSINQARCLLKPLSPEASEGGEGDPVPARLHLAGCSLKASGFSEPEAHRSLLQATRLKEQRLLPSAEVFSPTLAQAL